MIRSSRELDLYQRAFEDLSAQARYGDEARAIITAASSRA